MTGSSSATMTRPPPTSPAEEFTKSIPLNVPAAQHGDGWTAGCELAVEQRGNRDGTARFDHQFHAIEQQSHRASERGVVDCHDVVEVALMVREWEMSDLDRQQAVR